MHFHAHNLFLEPTPNLLKQFGPGASNSTPAPPSATFLVEEDGATLLTTEDGKQIVTQ